MNVAQRPAAKRAYRACVGCALFNRDGLVFAGQRTDDTGGHWQMPQGGIDPGETPEAAARRELGEEIGTKAARPLGSIDRWLTYDLPPDIAARVWGGRYRGQRQRWFAFRFTGNDRDINLDAHPGTHRPEFAAWRWMELEALPGLVIAFKREIYVEVAAAFRAFARPAR